MLSLDVSVDVLEKKQRVTYSPVQVPCTDFFFFLVGDQEQEEVIRVWESKQGAKQDEISQTQGFFP